MTLYILGYLFGGLVATRWTVGMFVRQLQETWRQDGPEDADDWGDIAAIGVGTVLFWPLGILIALGWGLWRIGHILGLSRWVKWFYTLDRQRRKEIFR